VGWRAVLGIPGNVGEIETSGRGRFSETWFKVPGAGITFVAVHFDGSGDEGVNEEIKCYATEDYAYEESEIQEANFSCLQEHFETLVPYGYENGCGGFGDVILNVKTRKITVERNDRFEDYTTSTYEV
jgi:hypothetical protein